MADEMADEMAISPLSGKVERIAGVQLLPTSSAQTPAKAKPRPWYQFFGGCTCDLDDSDNLVNNFIETKLVR